MTGPAFDELLRRLVAADVRFVLIGGLAVNAWGVVRGTKDLDIVAEPETDNFDRLAGVATAAGGQVHARDAFLSSSVSIAGLLAQGDRVQIETDLGPLDVVQGLPAVPPYDRDMGNGGATVDAGGVAIGAGAGRPVATRRGARRLPASRLASSTRRAPAAAIESETIPLDFTSVLTSIRAQRCRTIGPERTRRGPVRGAVRYVIACSSQGPSDAWRRTIPDVALRSG